MGRSVSVPSNAEQVAYATFECEDAEDAQWMFDDCIENLQHEAKSKYPSLTPCDEWLGREDHAILENGHAYITVSEYCGLVAIAVVPKEHSEWYTDTARLNNLTRHWCSKVDLAPLAECFGTRLISQGFFSNGEQVLRAANPEQTKGDLGLGFTSKEGWL